MPKRTPAPDNPWGLTAAEFRVVTLTVEHGHHKLVARELNRSIKTVEAHWQAIRRKIGGRNMVRCVLMFDRWQRGVPA
jgi:DNA-binding CsgD family transcriptional regulator